MDTSATKLNTHCLGATALARVQYTLKSRTNKTFKGASCFRGLAQNVGNSLEEYPFEYQILQEVASESDHGDFDLPDIPKQVAPHTLIDPNYAFAAPDTGSNAPSHDAPLDAPIRDAPLDASPLDAPPGMLPSMILPLMLLPLDAPFDDPPLNAPPTDALDTSGPGLDDTSNCLHQFFEDQKGKEFRLGVGALKPRSDHNEAIINAKRSKAEATGRWLTDSGCFPARAYGFSARSLRVSCFLGPLPVSLVAIGHDTTSFPYDHAPRSPTTSFLSMLSFSLRCWGRGVFAFVPVCGRRTGGCVMAKAGWAWSSVRWYLSLEGLGMEEAITGIYSAGGSRFRCLLRIRARGLGGPRGQGEGTSSRGPYYFGREFQSWAASSSI
ncbi:hypothetical protein Salat_0673300 [Sesamum alatum]|uniref:Uncharacterized protein n=1 Tax=Sesamum alatum TaxID=300844 RepID=A0AAE1YRK5_9LAMI|nr:hypothetical protein Salat_0673300 [Sesamum alatum]